MYGQFFSLNDNITVHIQTHSGETQIRHEVWSQAFSIKSHIKTHTEVVSFWCIIYIKKKASPKNNLNIHMMTHTGEASIMCEVCSKVFSHNITLKIHMKTHNGEVLFHSAVCNKAFADS